MNLKTIETYYKRCILKYKKMYLKEITCHIFSFNYLSIVARIINTRVVLDYNCLDTIFKKILDSRAIMLTLSHLIIFVKNTVAKTKTKIQILRR